MVKLTSDGRTNTYTTGVGHIRGRRPWRDVPRQGTSSQYQYCYLDLVIWYYLSAQPIQIVSRQCCLDVPLQSTISSTNIPSSIPSPLPSDIYDMTSTTWSTSLPKCPPQLTSLPSLPPPWSKWQDCWCWASDADASENHFFWHLETLIRRYCYGGIKSPRNTSLSQMEATVKMMSRLTFWLSKDPSNRNYLISFTFSTDKKVMKYAFNKKPYCENEPANLGNLWLKGMNCLWNFPSRFSELVWLTCVTLKVLDAVQGYYHKFWIFFCLAFIGLESEHLPNPVTHC